MELNEMRRVSSQAFDSNLCGVRRAYIVFERFYLYFVISYSQKQSVYPSMSLIFVFSSISEKKKNDQYQAYVIILIV